MIKKILASLGFGTAAVLVTAGSALAAAVTNGSFESGIDPGSFTTLSAGDSSSISNWTVNGGGVDYIGTYWNASNGSRSLDLSALTAGGVSQTLSTYPGHVYNVSFDMAGNPDGGNTVKTMDVDTGGAPMVYTFDTTGHDKTNMGWQTKTYSFTATGSSTVLTFTSMENNPYGPALDNVAISVNQPSKEKQCDKGGWKEFTNPSFKNEEQCEKWVHAEGEGNLTLSSPDQRVTFNAWNKTNGHDGDDGNKSNTVEYWNYDYPGVLHYTAPLFCTYVNPQTNEVRFAYQIPSGNPLSGTYIVADAKKVKNAPDTFGFSVAPDQATATQWCQNGFTPANQYTATSGHVRIETED